METTQSGNQLAGSDGEFSNVSLQYSWETPSPWPLNITTLKTYLTLPLAPSEKLPLPTILWEDFLNQDARQDGYCLSKHLESVFIREEKRTVPGLIGVMSGAIGSAAPESTASEDVFHRFWDNNILEPLRLFLGGVDSRWIRNSNQDTETSTLRPDFGLLLSSACLFRGEEKRPTFSGQHPRQELVEKTRWVYDPAPYVLGYYAFGATITIVAITPASKPKPKRQVDLHDLVTTNLSGKLARIKNIPMVLRLAKVLRNLVYIGLDGADTDMLPLFRENGKMIELFEAKIRKMYPLESLDRVAFLKTVYDLIKDKHMPNTDMVVRYETHHSRGCFVDLEPRGVEGPPQSTSDVENAVAHASPQILHRDIRWPNVIQDVLDSQRWLLIDWEDAAIAPTKASLRLDPSTHAPQVFQDGHGPEVDIWAVGKLITTASIYLPEMLVALGQKMVTGAVVSAKQALAELRSL